MYKDNPNVICGDCIEEMKKMPKNSVNFTLTDIPYSNVNRKDNGIVNLDKGRADIQTFDTKEFLDEVFRITTDNILVFCGNSLFSEIYKYFLDITKKKKGTVRPIIYEKTIQCH